MRVNRIAWIMATLAALVGLIIVGASAAGAESGGISGRSGNPATNGGATCTSCHSGGATPTVAITGPATVTVGATNTYTLTISGGQQDEGGLDVSVTSGVLADIIAGTRLSSGELVHSTGKAAAGDGTVSWTFDWTAPGTAGSTTMYGAGLSSNGSGTGGDGTGTDVLAITVEAAANVPPTADAGGPYAALVGATVTFDGSASADSDGTIASYAWDFGDGGSGTGVAPTHVYATSGPFTVSLTVTDDGGATGTDTATATITDPPIVGAESVLLVEPGGLWHIRVAGSPDRTFWYGVPGDIPLFGDWDGDGIDTPGAWRQGAGGGFAYLTNSLPLDGEVGVADFDFFFGIPGDEVFSGDWNGDLTDTLGINRAGHIFLADTNGTGGAAVPTDYDFWFGVSGDRAFGGDADDDGDDGVFLYRESDGYVYFTNETPVGPAAVATTADFYFFGVASDSFVAGDWDADGVDTAGIFRGSDTTVYLSNTNASGGAAAPTDLSYVWGTAGWTPVAGLWGDTPS